MIDHSSTETNQSTVYTTDAGRTVRFITAATYLTAFTFGLIGNIAVIYVIGKFRTVRSKSVANIYIWNLALSDLFLILQLPFFCYSTIYKDWPFGFVTCKTARAVGECNKFCSIFTLVALSVDRYCATNLNIERPVQQGKIICGFVWFLSLALSSPYVLYVQVVHNNITSKLTCAVDWPSSTYQNAWVYFQLSIGFLLPFSIIVIAYVALATTVKAIKNKRRRLQFVNQAYNRMTQTIVLVVSFFFLTQAPYHGVQLFNVYITNYAASFSKKFGRVYFPSQTELTTFTYINAVATALVFVSSCVNPIIYGIFNENFRNLYYVAFCCCRKRQLPHKLQEDVGVLPSPPTNSNAQTLFKKNSPNEQCPNSYILLHEYNTRQSENVDNGSEPIVAPWEFQKVTKY